MITQKIHRKQTRLYLNFAYSRIKTAYLRFKTNFYVYTLQLRGLKIKIGKGTIFASTSSVSPGNGCIVMGENCFVGRGTIIRSNNGKICFGNNVSIGEYSIIHGQGKVYIGENGLISSHISIVPAHHNFNRRDIPIKAQGNTSSGIWIGNDVWIGSGTKILDGVRIGKGSILGAGSIATKNIESFSIYAGNPAKKIRNRD